MSSRPGIRSSIALLVGSLLITMLNYQSAVAVTGSVSGYVGEGGNLTLTAPVGTVFTSVAFASYGTPDIGSTPYTLGPCHAAGSSTVVEAPLYTTLAIVTPESNSIGAVVD